VIPRRIDVMRSMGTRRVALFAGAASVAAIALAGCSSGQIAETSLKNASVDSVEAENADQSVLVRGLAVEYVGPKGYPAGANAKLRLNLYNQTTKPVTVRIGSQPLAGAGPTEGVVSATGVGLVGAAPSPVPSAASPADSAKPSKKPGISESVNPNATASAAPPPTPGTPPTPAGAAIRPAEINIPALSSVSFQTDDATSLQVVGLSAALVPGNSVNLVFAFSNGVAPLVVQAPVSTPRSPAPRGSALNEGVSQDQGH
jgi:hypothetical protein